MHGIIHWRILVVDDSGALPGRLGLSVVKGASEGQGEISSVTTVRTPAEAPAAAERERGAGSPCAIVAITVPHEPPAAVVAAVRQILAADARVQVLLCPTAALPPDLAEVMAASDRVLCLPPAAAAVEARQIARVLASKWALTQPSAPASNARAAVTSDLEAFLAAVPDAVFFKDRESRYVRASAALTQWLGLDQPGALAGKSDFDFFPEDQALQLFASDQEVIRTGQPITGHVDKLAWPNGDPEWVLTTRVPWRDAAGQLLGVLGVSRDISALKHSEEELEQSHHMLETLLETMPDRIYFKNTQSRFVKASRALASRLGLENPAQLVGRTDFDFHAPELARQFVQDEELVMATGKPLINKVEQQLGPDGRRIWASVTKVPIYDRLGQATGIIGISRDITELKRMQEELQLRSRELIDASRLAGMAEVATGVLHNIGNVLNSVNIAATVVSDMVRRSKTANLSRISALIQDHLTNLGDFLTKDPKGQQIPGYLEQLGRHLAEEQQAVLKELEEMRASVDHIRDIVSTQQGFAMVGGTREPVDLADMVDMALRMHDASLARHEVQVVREFSRVPPVLVEKYKLMQILVNLVRNAKQAIGDARINPKLLTVRIAVRGPERVAIEVGDNGVGIPAEALPKLFNLGFTTRKGGHGFGLHSSALAAEEMGGSLNARSEGPGCGATFILELPLPANSPPA